MLESASAAASTTVPHAYCVARINGIGLNSLQMPIEEVSNGRVAVSRYDNDVVDGGGSAVVRALDEQREAASEYRDDPAIHGSAATADLAVDLEQVD